MWYNKNNIFNFHKQLKAIKSITLAYNRGEEGNVSIVKAQNVNPKKWTRLLGQVLQVVLGDSLAALHTWPAQPRGVGRL